MTNASLLAILILSPLIGFLINGFLVKLNNQSYRRAGVIATAASSVSLLSAVFLWARLAALPDDARVIHEIFFNWLSVGDFSANMAFLVDPISAVMILIITGVG